ncbi:MAG: M16 family metallopeptidase, partial [Microcoleaceae cyanobacterium]
FGSWKPDRQSTTPLIPEPSLANYGGVFFVSLPLLNQSYIQMGHMGGQVDSPDYPELSVLNGVMNGFGGRLFNSIRSEKGLAYSVYGYWSAAYDYPGVFIAGGQTRSDATVEFIKAIETELEKIRQAPPSAEEIAYAKDSTLNSFIFNFEDPAQTLSRLMRYEYFSYPEDFIFQYRREVEATTAADVQRVAQQYLNPDKMVTLVVGSESAIEPPLTSLTDTQQVTSIDITIPQSS